MTQITSEYREQLAISIRDLRQANRTMVAANTQTQRHFKLLVEDFDEYFIAWNAHAKAIYAFLVAFEKALPNMDVIE